MIVSLVGAGCGGDTTETVGESAAAESAAVGGGPVASSDTVSLAGYNLLLVTLDTLRADRLGAYGYERGSTPNIDRLAAEGARFERVTTTVPATLPAHASIMTGLNPFEHGVRNNGAFVLRDDAVTLAEILRDQGYATAGFIGAVVLDAQFGIAQGFEHFDGLAAYQAETGDTSGERPGGVVVDRASAWIEGQTAPWFAWVHMYDPHDPYEPPEPYAGRFAADPYDGEIAYVDEMVGRLWRLLESTGAADNTLVVLTADHGEELGDHGEQGHSFFIYDSTVRVPMIWWAPGKVPAGRVVRGGTSVVDIFPTATALLGATADAGETSPAGEGAGVPGAADLSPLLLGADAGTSGRAYAESLIPYLDFGWSELRALVTGDYKYIAAPEPELYNLAADPGETENLVDVEVDRADAMAAELADLVADDDVTEVTGIVADADSLAGLQALGYLAGGGANRDRRDIDPKDMVETYEAFVAGLLDAIDAIADGRYGDANETLVRLDDLSPDSYIVYYYFGQLALEAGDPATSMGVLERALELNPSYLPTYTMLANALSAAGDFRGAMDLVAQAQTMFPGSFTLALLGGAIAHEQGELDEALAAYGVAVRLDPDHPGLLERMAHVHLLRQEPAAAVIRLEHLVEVTPENAPAWAQLALALSQTGDRSRSQAALDRALELDAADPMVRQIAAQLR